VFNTLRRRLILSHVLPLLVVIPMMGIALIYVLESQVLLSTLSGQLVSQSLLVAEMASDHPDIWSDPIQAQAFLARLNPLLNVQVILLDSSGRLLASNDAAAGPRQAQPLQAADIANAVRGQIVVHTNYSPRLSAQVVSVLAPVTGPGGRALGLVRLSHAMTSVYQQFLGLRYLIAAVLGVALLLGAAAGWILALNLERPLQDVTEAVGELAQGGPLVPLPEQGPEEIRLLLRAVNTFVERLQTLEHARRQLLANLVHELGRPLGAIHSAIEALQGGATDDAQLRDELLIGMNDEVSRLRRLLDDLAHLHDQILGNLELARRPTPLGSWLSGLLPTYRQAALTRGLRWQADIPPDLPILSVDPDRLGQAVGNLLNNAIKYTSPGGQVSVSAGLEDHSVWIDVGDTGPGIPTDEQDLIFAPFYRSSRLARFPQGMGLGLSIARDLTVAHGGALHVRSDPGQGSHFVIHLPVPD
jgi:two-component system, OmpR family, sensor histidine kinase BaeS